MACREAFIGRYKFNPDGSETHQGSPYYQFLDGVPQMPVRTVFSDLVTETSSSFVAIYNQAIAADASGLQEMVGIGLRKALEFLIKDFLINQEPARAEEIKGKLLGRCIEENVTDPNVKATAK
jgi:hypothetical protein